MALEKMLIFLRERNYGPFYCDEPLKNYTSWRVGGPADLLYCPQKIDECAHVLKMAHKWKVPLTILGEGSNVLISDQGIKGLVIITSGFQEILWQGSRVTAGAGVLLASLSRQAAQRGLDGLAFAVGIPGSLGGAVVMNAGAYGSSLKEVLTEVQTLDKRGQLKTYKVEELSLGYRQSIFKETQELIVKVTLSLSWGDKTEIQTKMAAYLRERRLKQPLEWPSAGSVFKNTAQGAGRLIEGVGAKGWSVGDAQVSEKHANFIINRGAAKASDIRALIKEVQLAVKEKYHLDLETEVVFYGFSDNGR